MDLPPGEVECNTEAVLVLDDKLGGYFNGVPAIPCHPPPY